MTRYEECLLHVKAHADHLYARADRGEINEWNIENVLRGFVDQPSYDMAYRERLVRECLRPRYSAIEAVRRGEG